MKTAKGPAVPFGIAHLEALPKNLVLSELRAQFENADEGQKLPLAYALAKFGDVRVEFLVQQIQTARPNEVKNLVTALTHARSDSLDSLEKAAVQAGEKKDWRLKARMAMVSLHLGSNALALKMCRLRPDPSQRSTFIDECSRWHGSLVRLAEKCAGEKDGLLRSGIVLAIGNCPNVDVSEADKLAWRPILTGWFQHASDGVTHSATEWAMKKWNLARPDIKAARSQSRMAKWHVNSIGMTMLEIPSGRFSRSIPAPTNDSLTFTTVRRQLVKLTRPFMISDREVTVGQFNEFVRDPNCADKEKPQKWKGPDARVSPTDQHPVQRINWYDAVLFCNWLSRREGLKPCYIRTGKKETIKNTFFRTVKEYDAWRYDPNANGYRLPTEAELEYAGRSGSESCFFFGDDRKLLAAYAVYHATTAAPCGSKMPNGWGLFDVHGNTWEWCNDRSGVFSTKPSITDPTGPTSTLGTPAHIHRGGAWQPGSDLCDFRWRSAASSDFRGAYNGLRVARNLPADVDR